MEGRHDSSTTPRLCLAQEQTSSREKTRHAPRGKLLHGAGAKGPGSCRVLSAHCRSRVEAKVRRTKGTMEDERFK